MKDLEGKKLLVLAGKPIGSCEIVDYAKSQGVYTIVSDYLNNQESAAKRIADQSWDISTADIETLKQSIIDNDIDGIYTGVHEFNIEKMIELCTSLNFPCFCTMEQWKILNNKKLFKQLCKENDIPVTKEFRLEDLENEKESEQNYPVVVKPIDGSGSRGFSICGNLSQLKIAYENAIKYSQSKRVLIEKYMHYEHSVIINYTLVDGKIFFNGISDKQSKKVFESGAPIMSIQFYPSVYEKNYLDMLNEKVKTMFLNFGLRNGVIWIEAFCDKGEFVFNEMGFRFGGSLTYLPVKYLYGVNQLALQVEYALTGKNNDNIDISENRITNECYCIFPVHVKPGLITKINGLETLQRKSFLKAIVPVHYLGDCIQDWGSAQQVFAYIHFVAVNRAEVENCIDEILDTLSIENEFGENILFNLYREI